MTSQREKKSKFPYQIHTVYLISNLYFFKHENYLVTYIYDAGSIKEGIEKYAGIRSNSFIYLLTLNINR